jgi:tetratricopeptide (TPR) repeat protein/CHAT domain-containing protein
MSLFEQNELASTLKHYSQCEVVFAQIQRLCHEITSILNKVDRKGDIGPEAMKNLQKNAQLLWDQLLTRPVKDQLKDTRTPDLIISIDEELINIPWELLYDGSDFLCLKFNLGRVIRTKEQVKLPQYRSPLGIPKMLILANPTGDLKSAYLEGVYIKNQFDRKRKELNIDFKSTNIDTLYVKKNLRDYDIVHFAGHCEFDADEPKNTGWVFNDARLTTGDILAIGSTISLPSLVFSNACYSAALSSDLIDIDYQEKNYSLASAFLFSGVRHYIGAIRRIEDQMSLSFSKEFYSQLISGKPVGESLRLGRLNLIKEHGITSIAWAGYLLYGDPNFVLFKHKVKQAGTALRKILTFNKKQLSYSLSGIAIISMLICLYMWLPKINPSAYLLFSKSQRQFLKGDNQEVIFLAKRIIAKDPLFLAVYPLLADTYSRLGKPAEALKYYFEYALLSEKKNDRKELASAYIGIAKIYHAQGEYPKAFDFYNKALALSRKNQDRLNEAISLRRLAVWHLDKEENDKALELLIKSSEINRQRQYSHKHRYNLACDYFDIALVFTNRDDFSGAKEFYQKSLGLFERLKLKHELSDYYFNLGEIYSYEKQYQKTLDCYLKGLEIDQAQNNLPSIASDYNMMGELYLEMDNLAKAEESFNQALAVCSKIDAPLELAATYYNLGLLYKEKGKKNKAREYLRQAQEIYAGVDTPDYKQVKQDLLTLDSPG